MSEENRRMPQRRDPVTGEVTARSDPSPPASVGETVTVACNVPNGLVLRLFRFEVYSEPVMGGGVREAKRAIPLPDSITLNGPGIDLNRLQVERSINKLIIGGYALTSGVPKDFWDRWFHDNESSPLVRNRVVFAQSTDDRARSQAREQSSARSGLEPIKPNNPNDPGDKPDPRMGLGRGRVETFRAGAA